MPQAMHSVRGTSFDRFAKASAPEGRRVVRLGLRVVTRCTPEADNAAFIPVRERCRVIGKLVLTSSMDVVIAFMVFAIFARVLSQGDGPLTRHCIRMGTRHVVRLGSAACNEAQPEADDMPTVRSRGFRETTVRSALHGVIGLGHLTTVKEL